MDQNENLYILGLDMCWPVMDIAERWSASYLSPSRTPLKSTPLSSGLYFCKQDCGTKFPVMEDESLTCCSLFKQSFHTSEGTWKTTLSPDAKYS